MIYLTALAVVLVAAGILVFVATRGGVGGSATSVPIAVTNVDLTTTSAVDAMAPREVRARGNVNLRLYAREEARKVARVAPQGTIVLATPIDEATTWYKVAISAFDPGMFVLDEGWTGELPEYVFIFGEKVDDPPVTVSSTP